MKLWIRNDPIRLSLSGCGIIVVLIHQFNYGLLIYWLPLYTRNSRRVWLISITTLWIFKYAASKYEKSLLSPHYQLTALSTLWNSNFPERRIDVKKRKVIIAIDRSRLQIQNEENIWNAYFSRKRFAKVREMEGSIGTSRIITFWIINNNGKQICPIQLFIKFAQATGIKGNNGNKSNLLSKFIYIRPMNRGIIAK